MPKIEDLDGVGPVKRDREEIPEVNNQGNSLPRKKFYRARAHCNPLSDSQFPVPLQPDEYNWEAHYPEFFEKARAKAKEEGGPDEKPLVRFADVGCGFGGLLVRLSPLFPDQLAVGGARIGDSWTHGMEIRDKVSQYVKERCVALRREHPGSYENISCIRTNSMKYLPNFFKKGQLTKLFFLFPDPHFKTANHRRRIIQRSLLTEYAYTLAVGGIMYTITDVEELGTWMSEKISAGGRPPGPFAFAAAAHTALISAHPCFERLTKEELESDPVIPLLFTGTEEGQKVERNEGSTFLNCFRRIAGPK